MFYKSWMVICMSNFKQIVNMLKSSSDAEKERLFLYLKETLKLPNTETELINELRESKFHEGFNCPHCESEDVIRHGKFNNRQRYKCKNCNKSFSDFTNTPLYRTRYPDEWIKFIECMIEGYSLRKCEEIIGINWTTLFYWRHKVLSALTKMDFEHFEGIVEMDETYIDYSEKGKRNIVERKPRKRGGRATKRGISNEKVCILVARDRMKNIVSKVACLGRIRKVQMEAILGSKVNSNNILCTDDWKGFQLFSEDKKVKEHYRFNTKSSKRVSKVIYHIQNVNRIHGNFKQWILFHFKGVASKYLNHYLAWFNFIDSKERERTIHNLKEMLISSCMLGTNATNESLRLSKFETY